MTSTTTVDKKDIQKLQRAIVDGLEDVKAQDIQVFDTAHLSPLFERVIVASGTSNRQTKALAASVKDAVREAGFAKPRTEGESNGEWIIVDCGQAVVHVMQPNFRQYYKLEELWGEKPVRLKLGAAKPVAVAKAVSETTPVKKAVKKATASPSLRRSSAAKLGALELNPPKPKLKKTPAKKVSSTATVKVVDAPAKVAIKKVAVKKVVAKKAPAKKAATKKVASKD
jgi:ribosome-associated protein